MMVPRHVGAAAGQQQDQDEIVEIEGEARDQQRQEGRHDLRQGDGEEDPERARAFERRGLLVVLGHRLQEAHGEQHHVGIAEPDVDDDDHDAAEERIGVPVRPEAEERLEHHVDLAEVLVEQRRGRRGSR